MEDNLSYGRQPLLICQTDVDPGVCGIDSLHLIIQPIINQLRNHQQTEQPTTNPTSNYLQSNQGTNNQTKTN